MNPEDCKTYWRTCHLTPPQIETERIKAKLQARQDAFQREIDKIITEEATKLTDRMELQMMGIKP